MTKLRNLSASTIVKFLKKQGFIIDRQTGSHIIFVRETINGAQVLTIPNHREIDKGMTKALYNQIGKFVSEESLKKVFYT